MKKRSVLSTVLGISFLTASTALAVPTDFTGAGVSSLGATYDERDGSKNTLVVEATSFYSGEFFSGSYGKTGDIQGFGDMDGDGLADLTYVRLDEETDELQWFTKYTDSNLDNSSRYFGLASDIAMTGYDVDFDGISDIAVFRPSLNRFIYYASASDTIRDVDFPVPSNESVVYLQLVDLNADGDLDFVAIVSSADASLSGITAETKCKSAFSTKGERKACKKAKKSLKKTGSLPVKLSVVAYDSEGNILGAQSIDSTSSAPFAFDFDNDGTKDAAWIETKGKKLFLRFAVVGGKPGTLPLPKKVQETNFHSFRKS